MPTRALLASKRLRCKARALDSKVQALPCRRPSSLVSPIFEVHLKEAGTGLTHMAVSNNCGAPGGFLSVIVLIIRALLLGFCMRPPVFRENSHIRKDSCYLALLTSHARKLCRPCLNRSECQVGHKIKQKDC